MCVLNTPFYQLYVAGARNFVVINVPPMDRSPLGKRSNKFYPNAITTFNLVLAEMVLRLAREHSDVTVFIFDANALFQTAMDSPRKFQQTKELKNVDMVCGAFAGHPVKKGSMPPACGFKLEEYFWLDHFHPTYLVHQALAEKIAKFLKKNKSVHS